MTPSRLVRFSLPLAIAAASMTVAAQANPPAKPQPNQPAAPQAAPTVGSAVGAITLPVTVVDDKGNPVKNLKADDLKLTDNGA